MKEYSWNITGYYRQDANEVGRELEKIEVLIPENVVNVARDETLYYARIIGNFEDYEQIEENNNENKK